MSSSSSVQAATVEQIRDGKHYFDVVIICTTDDHQASYWMDMLSPAMQSKILAVSEDWNAPGGAGNGLGTLYAWQKACALATTKYNLDMTAGLADGTLSAALYHTAGKGTRLAPLPASENNNKPGVKLPFPLFLPDGTVRPLTVLEAVMRQTAIYARKGRLSVFWGDQVFLPSVAFDSSKPATHHVDILCRLLGDTAPTAAEWQEQGLEKYGVVAVLKQDDDKTEAAQVEKVSHETATRMLAGLSGTLQQVGPSLGSFSVNAPILKTLLEEFQVELTEKSTKLDTDPHFWMPLTLSLESYKELMLQKKTPEEEAVAHYNRMAKVKTTFLEQQKDSGLGLFGSVDVGKDVCWWDYGLLKLYSKNSLLLLQPDANPSAKLLRQFLGLSDGSSHVVASVLAEGSTMDEPSYVVSSKLGAASNITSSLVAGVACPDLKCEGAIVINCAAPSIQAAKGAILYNILSPSDPIVAEPGQVKVGLASLSEDGSLNSTRILQSHMDIDGGTAWKEQLPGNDASFEGVHAKNYNVDIGAIARQRQEYHDKLAKSFGFE